MFHATDKVINLITDENQLISVVTATIGDGPHNIVLPLERFETPHTSGVSSAPLEQQLTVNGFEIDWSDADLWNPRPNWDEVRRHKQHIREATPRMLEVLRLRTPDPGVLHLLGDQPDMDVSTKDHFVRAMKAPAQTLISGLRDPSPDTLIEAVHGLAGLGNGLTPAGDDLLAGAMLACWAGFFPQESLHQLPIISREASVRTTKLSGAYLRSASEGEFGIIWHMLLEALIRKDLKQVTEVLNSIMEIGHNSGAYTLAGFILLSRRLPGEA